MPLLTAQELAGQLKVTVDTIWRYTRLNRIPCLRLGPRDYRYDLEQVIAALAGRAGEQPEKQAEPDFHPADPEAVKSFLGVIRPEEADS